MRILHVSGYFLPEKGGIEYAVYNLSKQFIRQGHTVSVVCSGESESEEVMDGIKVHRVPSFKILKTPISLSLYSALMKENPEVIHANYPHPFFFDVAVHIAKKKKIPLVINCHGPEIKLTSFLGRIVSFIHTNFFLKKALETASAIILNTSKPIQASKILPKFKEKITIIPAGIDFTRFIPQGCDLFKERLGLKGKNIILFAGTLRWYKGLNYLIDSLPAVLSEFPNTMLVIVGEGDQKDKLISQIKSLGIENNIRFEGFVQDELLLKYYSIADVFVLPSPTLEESFGMVALESLAMEKPAIVTSGAGVSEVFNKEKIGVVVNPEDPEDLSKNIIDLLKNPDKRRQIGKKARQILLRKYSWDKLAVKYLQVYEDACAGEKEQIRKHYSADQPSAMFCSKTIWGRLMRKEFAYVSNAIDPADKKILDIGCGPGMYSLEFAKSAEQVVAVDFAPNMLMTARENAEARNQVINILNSDAEFLPFKDKSFDIVLCLAVLHHMDDSLAEKVLAEACRVLQPGGLLVTDFRNKSNPILKYAYNKNSKREFLLKPRTLEQVREQLRENGFKVSKIKGIGSPVLPPYIVLIGEKI